MSVGAIIPADLMAELHQAAQRAARGDHDREAMRRACDRMDSLGEAIQRRHGVLEVGTSAIRELRDS